MTPRRLVFLVCALYAAALATIACTTAGGDASASATANAAPPASTAAGGLTPFQIEHGIGPVTAPVTLGPPNHAMAERGEHLFEQKCAACHKMGERYVGPALGEVTKRRTPAFVMNMVLNPQGMVEKHPVTRKLLGEFFVQMPNQQLTQDEARMVVEYLRTKAH
jgi:cytochrome c1